MVTCLLLACANGGSVNSANPGDAAPASDGASTSVQEVGTATSADAGGTRTPEASGTGDDATAAAETSTVEDAESAQDASDFPETSTPTEDAGTATGGVCGSSAIYALEAAVEVASGNITFCFSGTCAAGQCCYEKLSPGDICVPQ